MITWALDDATWDVGIDGDTKGIAIKSDSQQIAQDVASSVRVWSGELPMDIERGINYGNPESLRGSLNFEMREQAKLIDGVSSANVVFNELQDRTLDVTIYVTTTEGQIVEVK